MVMEHLLLLQRHALGPGRARHEDRKHAGGAAHLQGVQACGHGLLQELHPPPLLQARLLRAAVRRLRRDALLRHRAHLLEAAQGAERLRVHVAHQAAVPAGPHPQDDAPEDGGAQHHAAGRRQDCPRQPDLRRHAGLAQRGGHDDGRARHGDAVNEHRTQRRQDALQGTRVPDRARPELGEHQHGEAFRAQAQQRAEERRECHEQGPLDAELQGPRRGHGRPPRRQDPRHPERALHDHHQQARGSQGEQERGQHRGAARPDQSGEVLQHLRDGQLAVQALVAQAAFRRVIRFVCILLLGL
mmetsp:Transcript_37973/g.114770  ORF Transcript_37973/g.114770 Transcript_37973/m.114770 type:complete len:300 (-) Transcript_37973:2004-2903(-)